MTLSGILLLMMEQKTLKRKWAVRTSFDPDGTIESYFWSSEVTT